MVKTSNFNGIQLPSIGTWTPSQKRFELTAQFGYESYAMPSILNEIEGSVSISFWTLCLKIPFP